MNAEFWGNVQPLTPQELKKKGSVCFLSKKERLKVQLESMAARKSNLEKEFESKKRIL